MSYPKLLSPGLWRVDIRDYRWNPEVWEKLANVDVFFHRLVDVEVIEVVEEVVREKERITDIYGREFEGKEVERLIKKKIKRRRKRADGFVPLGAGQLASLSALTKSQAPIVRADWFLVQGARQISLANLETGVGYYDWLELRNLNDYLKLIGDGNAKKTKFAAEKTTGPWSMIQESAQNREIIRRLAKTVPTGSLWTCSPSSVRE